MYKSKPPALVESTLILTLTIAIVFDPNPLALSFFSVMAPHRFPSVQHKQGYRAYRRSSC
jgi:hypothetical protein